MPVTVQASIIVSDSLHIVPVTRKDKLRFWNKFPVSRIDRSFDGINFMIEYNFKASKGFDGTQDQTITVNTYHVFSTIVTLFRLVGVHCGIYDKTTPTRLDLPIHHIPVNLFVSSLGVAYSTHPYVDLDTLLRFKDLWMKYGDLLVINILNNQRFEGDRFANLKISINRFSDSFERKGGTDQFIDNIVAIEALFSKKDDKFTRDKTERLSKRLAVYLETDYNKREEIFCEMIKLYRLRNEIIHGGYTEKYDIVKPRNYLIRCYLAYFEFLTVTNFSHIAFIRSLDLEAKKITKTYKDCVNK